MVFHGVTALHGGGERERERERETAVFSARVVSFSVEKLDRREKREWTKEKRETDETRISRVKDSTNRFLKSKLPCKTPDETI